MGRVWLAHDEMLHREVAVKEIVLPAWMKPGERADLYERTLREARAVARLNDPYVVQIFDVVYREERPWIVMEYIPARSLYQVVQEDGPVPPREAARIGLAVLSALEAAHRAGVLHRDVKPGNVLVAGDGRVVLTDFGLATFLDGDAAMTTPGLVLGSPQYIAPERAREGVSTPAADLWSLGATLHAAVEGRSPFARSTAMATLAALAGEPPAPAPHAGPLRPVLDGLLCKDPERRMGPERARALLTAIASGRRVPPPPRRPGAGRWRRAALRSGARAAGADRGAESSPPGGWPRPGSGHPDDERPLLLADLGGGGRDARAGWIVVAAVVGVLAAVAVLTAVLRGGAGSGDAAAPGRTGGGSAAGVPTAVAVATISPCAAPAPSGAPAPVEATAAGREPYPLPQGWRWYHDGSGFRVAVRNGWRATAQDGAVCFHDGDRTLGVERLAGTVDPLAHIRADERWIQRHDLPGGYQRIQIARSAEARVAEWEYRSTGPDGTAMHAQRTTVRISGGRTFDVFWQTGDPAWHLDLDLLRLIMASFAA